MEILGLSLVFMIVLALLFGYHKHTRKQLEILLKEKEQKLNTEIANLHSEIDRWKVSHKEMSHHANSLEVMYQEKQAAWQIQTEKEIREDANKRSRATIRGQATEHLAPYMMEDYSPKDFRFIGDPIDYLVCVGTGDMHDGVTDQIAEVILLDIKTNKARLNKIQRRIRDAVLEGRVSFMTYNTDTQTTRKWSNDKSTI